MTIVPATQGSDREDDGICTTIFETNCISCHGASGRGDLSALIFSVVTFAGYQIYVNRKSRGDPHYSIQQMISAARVAWVETIMLERRDILAVQTLRNSIMAATFRASTGILLIINVLTLSEQGDKLSSAWHSLNFVGHVAQQIWLVRLLAILLDLLVAFFSFAMAIRLFHCLQ